MPQRLNPQDLAGALPFSGAASGVRLDLSSGRPNTRRYDIDGVANAVREVFGEKAQKRRTEKQERDFALGYERFMALQNQIVDGQDQGGRLAALTARINTHPVAQAPFQRGVAKAKLDRGMDELVVKLNLVKERVPVADENGAPLSFEEVSARFGAMADEATGEISYLDELSGDPYVGTLASVGAEQRKAAAFLDVQKRAADANIEWVQAGLGHRVTKALNNVVGPLSDEETLAVRESLSESIKDARRDNVPGAADVVVNAALAYAQKQLNTDGGADAAIAALDVLEELEINGALLTDNPNVSPQIAQLKQQAQAIDDSESTRGLQRVQTLKARLTIEVANFLTENEDALLAGGDLREAARQELSQRKVYDPEYAGLFEEAYREVAGDLGEGTRPGNPKRMEEYLTMRADPNATIAQLSSFTQDELGPLWDDRRTVIAQREDWQRVVKVGDPLVKRELDIDGAVRAAVDGLGAGASQEVLDRASAVERAFFDAMETYAREEVVPQGLGSTAEFDLLRKFAKEQGAVYRQRLTTELSELRATVDTTKTNVRALVREGKYGEASALIAAQEQNLDPRVFGNLVGFVAEAGKSEAEMAFNIDPTQTGSLADAFVSQASLNAGALFARDAEGATTDARVAKFNVALRSKIGLLAADSAKLRSLIDPLSGTANDGTLRQLMQSAADEAGAEAFGDDWGAVQSWQKHSQSVVPFAEAVAASATPARTYYSAQEFSPVVADAARAWLTGGGTRSEQRSIVLKMPELRAAGATDAELFDLYAPMALGPQAIVRGELRFGATSGRLVGQRGGDTSDADLVLPLPQTVDFYTVSLGEPESVRRWYAGQGEAEQAAFMARVTALSTTESNPTGITSFDTLMAIQEQHGLHSVRAGVR